MLSPHQQRTEGKGEKRAPSSANKDLQQHQPGREETKRLHKQKHLAGNDVIQVKTISAELFHVKKGTPEAPTQRAVSYLLIQADEM